MILQIHSIFYMCLVHPGLHTPLKIHIANKCNVYKTISHNDIRY